MLVPTVPPPKVWHRRVKLPSPGLYTVLIVGFVEPFVIVSVQLWEAHSPWTTVLMIKPCGLASFPACKSGAGGVVCCSWAAAGIATSVQNMHNAKNRKLRRAFFGFI